MSNENIVSMFDSMPSGNWEFPPEVEVAVRKLASKRNIEPGEAISEAIALTDSIVDILLDGGNIVVLDKFGLAKILIKNNALQIVDEE